MEGSRVMKRGNIAMKNISSNLLLQFVVIISGFIIPKLLISSFGSDTYGLVSSITQFLSLIMLLEAGIGPVIKAKLYKYIAKDDKNKILLVLKDADKFFKRIGFIFVIYVLILCFIYPIMNNEFSSSFTISLIIIMAVSTLFEYFFGIVYNLYLQADKKYYVTSYVQIVCYILNIILVVVLIHFGASVFVVKIANTLAFVVKPIFQSWYVRKKMKIEFKNAKGEYKIENKFDGLSQHIAYVICSNTDVTVLTVCTNLTTVAIYSVYNLVGTAVKNVVSAFTNGMDSIFGDMMARNEDEALNRSFRIYEFLFYVVSMIIYLCTLILIVPFIRVYTDGITDANYIQPIFGIVLVLASLVGTARVIYSNLAYALGHFKQTNVISWVEAITNVVLSIVLVFKFGLVGVAIGTFVSGFIRLIYFMYYSSNNILKRGFGLCLKWLLVILFEVSVIIVLMNTNVLSYIPTNYFEWVVYAAIVLIAVIIFVLAVSILFNYNLSKEVFAFVKGKFTRNK